LRVSKARQPVIMFIAKAFRADGRASCPRPRQESESLLYAGYPVHVIAWDRYAECPTIENVNGITVRSFSSVNLTSPSKIGLVLGGLIFNALLVFETVKMIRQLKQRPIVHAHDINTLPIGSLLKKLHLCSRLVYDCHEFTYGVYYEWFNLLVAWVVSVIEQRLLPSADAVITVSDPMARYLRRFNPATEVVYNSPRTTDIPNVSKEEARVRLGLPLDTFIISSVGAIRYDTRMDLLLAVARLTEKHNIHFVVVGDGPSASEFRQAVKETVGTHIVAIPRVSHEKALLYVLASDLTWIVYQNRRESLNPRMTLPWKLFESLACGVPVVVDRGTNRAKLVGELHCGIVLDSDAPEDIAEVIVSLANNAKRHKEMSAAAKNSSVNWEVTSKNLVSTYERLR
jgi:glycosyltransferase involved in cell wall biosynthesis